MCFKEFCIGFCLVSFWEVNSHQGLGRHTAQAPESDTPGSNDRPVPDDSHSFPLLHGDTTAPATKGVTRRRPGGGCRVPGEPAAQDCPRDGASPSSGPRSVLLWGGRGPNGPGKTHHKMRSLEPKSAERPLRGNQGRKARPSPHCRGGSGDVSVRAGQPQDKPLGTHTHPTRAGRLHRAGDTWRHPPLTRAARQHTSRRAYLRPQACRVLPVTAGHC